MPDRVITCHHAEDGKPDPNYTLIPLDYTAGVRLALCPTCTSVVIAHVNEVIIPDRIWERISRKLAKGSR